MFNACWGVSNHGAARDIGLPGAELICGPYAMDVLLRHIQRICFQSSSERLVGIYPTVSVPAV